MLTIQRGSPSLRGVKTRFITVHSSKGQSITEGSQEQELEGADHIPSKLGSSEREKKCLLIFSWLSPFYVDYDPLARAGPTHN